LVASILTTARATILNLFSSVVAIHLMKNIKTTISQSMSILKWPVMLFIGLFMLLIFTNKAQVEQTGDIAQIALRSTVAYIVCPTAALDHVMTHPSDFTTAENHTFRSFLKVAAALHLITYTPLPALDDYVFVPYSTNVYTVYKPYITDFGLYGAQIAFLIIGFLHCVLYRKAKAESGFWLYIFAMTMFPVIMICFDDLYTWMFGFLLQASICYLIYTTLHVLNLAPNSFVIVRNTEKI
jgi:oligosaccharide repeat unit polymerase